MTIDFQIIQYKFSKKVVFLEPCVAVSVQHNRNVSFWGKIEVVEFFFSSCSLLCVFENTHSRLQLDGVLFCTVSVKCYTKKVYNNYKIEENKFHICKLIFLVISRKVACTA